MKKMLLHTCCAPCAIHPLRVLRDKGFEVTSIFYNPNIHPLDEYKKRAQALVDFSRGNKLEVIYPEYAPEIFFQVINPKETTPARCSSCWMLRLKETARFAREKGFQAFTTTLLVSPYQDQEFLKSIGDEAAEEEGIDFYYEDFRSGFRRAHEEAKSRGIYRQKYCGCLYSEIERCKSLEKQSLFSE